MIIDWLQYTSQSSVLIFLKKQMSSWKVILEEVILICVTCKKSLHVMNSLIKTCVAQHQPVAVVDINIIKYSRRLVICTVWF